MSTQTSTNGNGKKNMKKLRFVFPILLILSLFITLSGCNLTRTPTPQTYGAIPPPIPVTRSSTEVIAASNATAAEKTQADYVCTGTNDASTIMGIITTNGGVHYQFSSGTFNLEQRIYLNGVNNFTLSGSGTSTIFKVNNVVSTTVNSQSNSGQKILKVASTVRFVVGQNIFIGKGITSFDSGTRRDIGATGETATIQMIGNGVLNLTLNLVNTYTATTPVYTVNDAMYFDTCNNFKIQNIALDGNYANQTQNGADDYQNGIHLTNCSGFEISSNYIHDVVYNSVLAHPVACTNSNIHGNYFISNAVGGTYQNRAIVLESGSKGITISNNISIGNEVGINSVGSSFDAANNYCKGNKYGILLNDAFNCNIMNNTIDSPVGESSYGINILKGSHDNTLIGNSVISASNVAVQIWASNYNTFEGNFILLSQKTAMLLPGSTYNKILNNTIKDCGVGANLNYSGIYLFVDNTIGSQHNEIRGNSIVLTGSIKLYTCIRMDSSCGNNTITNNILNDPGNSALAMVINSTGNTIYQNSGYIASGEIRTISCTINGGNAGILTSVTNPFGQAVRVLDVQLEITTQSVAIGTLDVGIGSSATADYQTMYNALPTNPGTAYPYFYKSTISPGVQTIPINWATGSGNQYLNFYNATTNTNLVATYTITVMGN